MNLKLLSVLFIAFVSTGCLKRPKLEDCVINGDLQIGHCITKDNVELDRTIPEMHKYICRPFEDNALLENYIKELERRATNRRN